jgi:cytoskeletal protein CcmA (bactofilin family)
MLMTDRTIKRGETARLGIVDGDLNIGRKATIKAEAGGRVVVTGDVIFDGGATIDCSLECNSVEAKAAPHTGGTIKVNGDLTARGDVDVADSLEVFGPATAEGFDVGGHMMADSVHAKRVRVGGHFKVKEALESESVDVAGHLSAPGKVKVVDLHVGGHAEVGGGTISGSIQVRGHIEVTSRLEYGDLQTYGHVSLAGGSEGERLSVLGRVRFAGDSACRILEVKGAAEAKGDLSAEEISVLGMMRVAGHLKVSKGFKVLGIADVRGSVDCQRLDVEGRLNADEVVAVDEADVSGELRTVGGMKASSIAVRRGARVTGPLVGGQVEIGEKPGFGQWPSVWSEVRGRIGQMTEVEDVYGRSVRIAAYSQAKRVFAEEVQMDSGSIAHQVTYTKDLKLTPGYYIHLPPQKTDKLPEPPL